MNTEIQKHVDWLNETVHAFQDLIRQDNEELERLRQRANTLHHRIANTEKALASAKQAYSHFSSLARQEALSL